MSACEYWPGCSCGLCCAATDIAVTHSAMKAAATWRPNARDIEDLIPPGLILIVMARLLVLVADELDHFVFRRQPLRDPHGPRLGIRLRIVHRDVDPQCSVIHPRETLGQLQLVGERAAVDVEPPAVAEPARLDDQRVALPLADRIALPRRVRVLARQRTAVREDLPQPEVRLVNDQRDVGCLDDLPRLRMEVELQESHG